MKDLNTSMLTTFDNPFNPFTQFTQWNKFDCDMGYHTCAYLGRIAKTSDDLSEIDQSLAIEMAINEIVEFNITGNYRKVTINDYKN